MNTSSIMLTFPLKTYICERGISVLNKSRVKTFNRTTQVDERLTGFCIIYAYIETAIDWDKDVNTFAAKIPGRSLL